MVASLLDRELARACSSVIFLGCEPARPLGARARFVDAQAECRRPCSSLNLFRKHASAQDIILDECIGRVCSTHSWVWAFSACHYGRAWTFSHAIIGWAWAFSHAIFGHVSTYQYFVLSISGFFVLFLRFLQGEVANDLSLAIHL